MMANTTDLLLQSLDGDLLIVNGDLVLGNSIVQNEHDILEYVPGWIKQFPYCGVGIIQYENGQVNGLDSLIRKQISSDGLTINYLNISFNTSSQLDIQLNCSR